MSYFLVTDIVFLLLNLKTVYPVKPEMNDPTRIPIFAESIRVAFSTNARFVMKMDIVNPTPPKRAIGKYQYIIA